MVSENHTKSDIDYDVLWRTLLDMRDYGVKAINWTGGGEPTMYDDGKEHIPGIKPFDRLVTRANELGIKQGVFTNARDSRHIINTAHLLDWIRISLTDKYMDGLDKDMVRHYARQTSTGICINLTPENIVNVDDYCQQANDLGVAYFQVRPALARTYDKQSELPELPDLKRHETDKFSVYLSEYKFLERAKPKSYDKCFAGAFVPVIDYWGNVRRCNYHLNDPATIIGNLSDKSFSELMNSMPRYSDVRSDCQTCCKNHELNLLLNGLQNLADVDFV